MPPAFIASSMARTASPKRRSPRRNISFQKKRKIGALGNLGAPLKPPWTGSTALESASPMRSRSAGATPAPAFSSESFARWSARVRPRCSISSRRVRHVASTDWRTCRNEGRPVARLGRPIGAAEHRLAVGREKHGERPAALLAERVQRAHVDVVDVRPLLAVDLDVDEQRVHEARRFRVLERLVRHHMAPVAGGVADREQDRTVAPLGLGERARRSTSANARDYGRAGAGRARSPAQGDCGRTPFEILRLALKPPATPAA